MTCRKCRLPLVVQFVVAGGLACLAACQTVSTDSGGRPTHLSEWKEIDVSEVDLNVPLLISPKVTKAEYQSRDNQVNHYRLRLDGGNGLVYTQRYPDAWYDESTQRDIGDREQFKTKVAEAVRGDNVGYGDIREIKHKSGKSFGFGTVFDVKDAAKARCFFAQGAYRLKPRTYYDNDAGNVDTILTIFYCDPKVAHSDFSRALEAIAIVKDHAAFAAALAAK